MKPPITPLMNANEQEWKRYHVLIGEFLKDLSKVAKLNQVTNNPPTQAQVQAVANKLDELIGKLQG